MSKKQVIEMVAQLSPWVAAPGKTILDLGAGKGKIGELLAIKTEQKITLTDISDYNVTNLPLIIYDGHRLPFQDKSFDTTIIVFVLHHLAHKQQLLKEVKRVTKQRILIVEDTPVTSFAKISWWCWDHAINILERLSHSTYDTVFDHPLTPKEWQAIFKQLNLSLIHVLKYRNWSELRMYPHSFFVLDVKKPDTV